MIEGVQALLPGHQTAQGDRPERESTAPERVPRDHAGGLSGNAAEQLAELIVVERTEGADAPRRRGAVDDREGIRPDVVDEDFFGGEEDLPVGAREADVTQRDCQRELLTASLEKDAPVLSPRRSLLLEVVGLALRTDDSNA